MEELINKETMSSLQIAEITGKRHDAVLRDIKNLLSQGVAAHNFVVSDYKDATGRTLPCYALTKKGCLILASGYNAKLREKIIDRWEELETGQSLPIVKIRQDTKQPTTIKDKIAVAKFLSSFLNLNDSSKLLIAKSIADPLGLPTPDYTPSKGILKSASELLKENGITMSAQTFNAKLIELGYLVEFTRPSRVNGKSVVKKFKSITPKGMEYGENQVNPNNPKSTQPLWYADRFNELLALAR